MTLGLLRVLFLLFTMLTTGRGRKGATETVPPKETETDGEEESLSLSYRATDRGTVC